MRVTAVSTSPRTWRERGGCLGSMLQDGIDGKGKTEYSQKG